MATHCDLQSQFYDRHAQPIPKEHALEHAGHLAVAVNETSKLNPSLRAMWVPTKD
jgi:hypothetical protein